MEINLSRCALCSKETELRESHIIPKFVFRRLVKTAVGKLRSGINPNVPVQDGEKHKLLCSDCEGLFSTFEVEFASKIFYSFQDGLQKQFQYHEWLRKFAVSVSWRSLYLDLIDFVRNQIGNMESMRDEHSEDQGRAGGGGNHVAHREEQLEQAYHRYDPVKQEILRLFGCQRRGYDL